MNSHIKKSESLKKWCRDNPDKAKERWKKISETKLSPSGNKIARETIKNRYE